MEDVHVQAPMLRYPKLQQLASFVIIKTRGHIKFWFYLYILRRESKSFRQELNSKYGFIKQLNFVGDMYISVHRNCLLLDN